MKKKYTSTMLFVICFLSARPGSALRPMVHYHDLVAGQGSPGFRDGGFSTSLFNKPSGLALSLDHKRLFVADRNNNRIRAILLGRDNQVETLAGSGERGDKDADLLKSSFNEPLQVVTLPNDQLVVNDHGNNRLRLIDLKNHQITTLAGNGSRDGKWEGRASRVSLENIVGMVYSPSDHSVYFSQYGRRLISRLDLKLSVISTVLSQNNLIQRPKALCLFQNHVCVSSENSGKDQVFMLKPAGNRSAGSPRFSIKLIGSGKNIVALAASDNSIYAIQNGPVPFAKVNPYQPVRITTKGGLFLDASSESMYPFWGFSKHEVGGVGFLADPLEPRKFFMATQDYHTVIDFKDYDFGKLMGSENYDNPDGLSDFRYPITKPPHTIRILVGGDSQTAQANQISEGPITPFKKRKRMLTYPKQLELLLNTEAALNDIPLNFEVLVDRHSVALDYSLYNWPYYELPDLQEKFDADIVFLFVTSSSVKNYQNIFQGPSTREGILGPKADIEYTLKPEIERFSDPFVKTFYKKAFERGYLKPERPGGKTPWPNVGVFLQDPETRLELEKIMGKGLGMLCRKLNARKNKSGRQVGFFICYTPGQERHAVPEEKFHQFWIDVCSDNAIPLMDLTAPFEALKTTYAPAYDAVFDSHFNSQGNDLLAKIICHELLDKPWSRYWK